jgi:hypothetical protein
VSVLDSLTRRAGAVIDGRTGVAAHYGSAAGELAVCARGAGIADRSDLRKLELTGSGLQLEAAAAGPIAVGGCRIAAGGRLCARSKDRMLVLSESGAPSELDRPSLTVVDRSDEWAVIGLAGPAVPRVLAALGSVAEFTVPGTFTPVRIAGADVELALPTERLALMVAASDSARDVWRTLVEAGRPAGLSYVGEEAFRRYTLWERTARDKVAAAPPS